MNNTFNIHERMFSDVQTKTIFNKAQSYAYQYLDEVFERNVFPTDEALKNLKYFEEEMPVESSEASAVIDQLQKYGSPATVSQMGGRYFGFVNGGVVPAGLAAKNLATFWDQNPAMQVISPISSKLEIIVEAWLKQLLNLPSKSSAGFVSGTSLATFCGLAAARFRLLNKLGWDINDKGLYNAPPLRIVTSRQAHSTVLKAISLLGFGKDNIEWVDTDEQGRIIPDLIPDLDDKTILILQAGNVNTGAFDDFEQICKKARKSNSWIHIDGAFGLWAQVVDNLKYLTHGIENANSWAVDGHKTLNTPYDCGIILCEDREALTSALHMSGSYIIKGDSRDGMFFTPEMSRRSRIIELWATLKFLGRSGINQMLNGMHQRAIQFADALKEINGFEVLNEIVFNQVLVRCESDEITEKTMLRIQQLRECWVGGSSWNGRKVIRISICSWATTPDDVNRSVASFIQALNEVKNEMKILK